MLRLITTYYALLLMNLFWCIRLLKIVTINADLLSAPVSINAISIQKALLMYYFELIE